MPRKKMTKTQADRKYANGTTYKDPSGKTRKRTSAKGTKRGNAFCARTNHKGYNTPKGRARRRAWGCSGSKSLRK